MAVNIPPLLPSETKQKDGSHLHSANFGGFLKVKNLYITGHSDGAINFWDVSCPFLIPIFSLKQQVIFEVIVYIICMSRNGQLLLCWFSFCYSNPYCWLDALLRLLKLEHYLFKMGIK